VLYVILEKQPGVNCTQVGQGTECVDNAVCQNDVCTCTSDFYANGGMCATSKSYIKWHYKNPTQRVGLEESGPHHHLIAKLTCSRHDKAELVLNNDHSLTPYN
jgi:hypothetical protein